MGLKAVQAGLAEAISKPESWPYPRLACRALADRVIAYSQLKDLDALRESAKWARLTQHMDGMKPDERPRTMRNLAAHTDVASHLAFQVDVGRDKPDAVYALLNRLLEERPAQCDAFPALAAAIAIVHDNPPREARAKAPDPLELFDYYTQNSSRLVGGFGKLPVDQLVYTVATTASINELKWALQMYGGDRNIAKRYSEVPYDTEHFARGAPLKLDKVDFTLENIRRVGGICVHQAYFAANVGRALGIPAVVDSGRGTVVGHAWVGYLEVVGRTRWNFDVGRYDEYKATRGTVTDPQTGEAVSDAMVAITARSIGEKFETRFNASALAFAAQRMEFLDSPKGVGADYPPAVKFEGEAPAPRPANLRTRLDLLDAAVRLCPESPTAWRQVVDLAEAGKLTGPDLKKWTESVMQLCGVAYPDFALEVLTPLIDSAGDAKQKIRLWDWAYDKFYKGQGDTSRRRIDLAAAIRFHQGDIYEKADMPDQALNCYKEIFTQFLNESASGYDALARAQKLLETRKADPGAILEMYKSAWQRAKKPGTVSSEFIRGSNWFRIGKTYEALLRKAGRAVEADQIAKQLPTFQRDPGAPAR